MTTTALTFAMKKVTVPAGRSLWLYGDPTLAKGDIYSPWQGTQRATYSDIAKITEDYDAVILNCPKQQDESEGLLALALERSKGFVMVVAPKDAGGGRLIGMMEEYGIAFDTLSKDSCRVVWTFDAPKAKRDVIAKHKANLVPRRVNLNGTDWWTVPGLFGWNKIDAGSQMLMQHVPKDLSGHVADFGCGFGYISATLARSYPNIKKIDAFDADMRAVSAAKLNCGDKVQVEWQDIATLPKSKRYDAIIMNPPFHSGKREKISLGETFIRTAWDSLKPGGRLFFVANNHLPYEKIIPGLTSLFEEGAYKIITGQKP